MFYKHETLPFEVRLRIPNARKSTHFVLCLSSPFDSGVILCLGRERRSNV